MAWYNLLYFDWFQNISKHTIRFYINLKKLKMKRKQNSPLRTMHVFWFHINISLFCIVRRSSFNNGNILWTCEHWHVPLHFFSLNFNFFCGSRGGIMRFFISIFLWEKRFSFSQTWAGFEKNFQGNNEWVFKEGIIYTSKSFSG